MSDMGKKEQAIEIHVEIDNDQNGAGLYHKGTVRNSGKALMTINMVVHAIEATTQNYRERRRETNGVHNRYRV